MNKQDDGRVFFRDRKKVESFKNYQQSDRQLRKRLKVLQDDRHNGREFFERLTDRSTVFRSDRQNDRWFLGTIDKTIDSF